MANFLQEMIKSAIQEELNEALKELKGGATTPAQPQEDGSNSVNDKNTTGNTDTAKQAPQSATETPKPETQTISTEDFRKLIKDEVSAVMAKNLNQAPATQHEEVNVDAVYCKLLGFPTKQKGD